MMVTLSLKISQCDICSGLPMDRNPGQSDHSLLSLPKLELCEAKIVKREDEFELGMCNNLLTDSLVCHS